MTIPEHATLPGTPPPFSRRKFLATCAVGLSALLLTRFSVRSWLRSWFWKSDVFIGRAPDYSSNIEAVIRSGLQELNITPEEIRGKRILLKPNIVDLIAGSVHINTHPLVVRAAASVLRSLGALEITVAEGPAHQGDTHLLLEETGYKSCLAEDGIHFIDVNYGDFFEMPNRGRHTHLNSLFLPASLRKFDLIISLAKMKTHHWAGITLSMKNLYGLMPGIAYGWPKNVLHLAGIPESILDINATVRPHLAIVDGIVGMEGDGPILGTPKPSGVIVMGRELPAVDATCARVMGVNPHRVPYLAAANGYLGVIRERNIAQRGETLSAVRTHYELIDKIEAHRGIRM